MSFPAYDKYKASGFDWLGKIPKHWALRPLGSCFQERREKVSDTDYPPLSVTKNGVVPQLENAAKTDDNDNRKCVLKGDFVINSRSDRKGSSGMATQDGSVSLINTVLRPNTDVDVRFVHHLLRSVNFQEEFYRFGKGIVADLWSTNYSAMKGITLAIPPEDEQHAIASFLDRETAKIDALVAEQQRLIELLKEKRQAVISHAVTKGLDPHAKMKPSGIPWLGDVPEHWEVVPLKYLSAIKTGFAFKSEDFTDDGVPVLRIGDISTNGTVDFSDAKFLPTEFIDNHEDVLVQKDDIVMAMTGATIGKAAKYTHDMPALLNQRVCIFRASHAAAQSYVWFLVQTSYYMEHLAITAFGGAQPNISDNELVNICVPMPPLSEQQEITSYLYTEADKFSRLQSEAQHAITLLQERRTALISAAVTGKIDVRQVACQEAA